MNTMGFGSVSSFGFTAAFRAGRIKPLVVMSKSRWWPLIKGANIKVE